MAETDIQRAAPFQNLSICECRDPKIVGLTIALSIALVFGADLDITSYRIDALTDIVYKDECQIAPLNLRKTYDKPIPRIELVIASL